MSDPSDFKRLPRNALPIPCSKTTAKESSSYQRNQFMSPPSFDGSDFVVGSLPTASPSGYSTFDVVLDDGTLQKRTVSLSTLPNDKEDNTFDLTENESHPPTMHDTTPLLQDKPRPYYLSVDNNQQTYESSTTMTSSSEDTTDSDHSSFIFKKSIKLDKSNSIFAKVSRQMKHIQLSFQLTPGQKLVLKCSFAYILGSLFTFIPIMNRLIGNNRVSSHLVATATVFFNPAKTLGGMVEAACYGWGYVLFALVVCLGSMVTTDFFIDRNMLTIAHLVSIGFWLTGATFIVSFLKAHWNKPPVATASSLCFIIIFIIVVREGSANLGDFDTTRIQQITVSVAIGTLITISCCILFWPVSASKKLRNDLEANLMSYKVLLKLLTKTFLLDDDLPEFKANQSLKTAIEAHRTSFTSLQKSLQEAKLEVVWNDEVRGCTAEYDSVVKSMQRLAQSMDGLRSSCGLQFEIMQQDQIGQLNRNHSSSSSSSSSSKKRKTNKQSRPHLYKQETHAWKVKSDHHRRKFKDEIKRQKSSYMSKEGEDEGMYSETFYHQETDELDQPEDHDDNTLIEFIHRIRQPLKSLAYTCKQTIYHLQTGFSETQPPIRPSHETLKANLVKAIALFEASQKKAIKRLIQHRTQSHPGDPYGPQEDIFLVYFFVFNMMEFARELISLVESVQALSIARQKKRSLWTMLVNFIQEQKSTTQSSQKVAPTFVPNERHKMNTLHTPIPKTKWRQTVLTIWQTFSLFKLQKVRYATKATVAVVLLALPAFSDLTGAWFRQWRMEWALITLMVVMTPTVGGTNLVAIYRIFSTALGCFVAMCLYLMFPGNMYFLILGTWLFSIPNFWIILHHKHGKFGQFTLLAYNLVMLNKYNDRDTNQVQVTQLAFQRCVAIFVGVIFGLFATAYVWPYEARVELRKGVSDFLLRLAWLYQKLVSVQHSEQRLMFMDAEIGLQRTLLELQDLLKQTPNEPRLKGAFPVANYSEILASLQNITDKLGSMRTVVLKDVWFEQVQQDFIMPVAQERREMVGNVLLYFYILASAMRLKTPLPPYLPPARKAWDTFMVRLCQLPVVRSRRLIENSHIYLFYYAYVTALEDIIRELDKLGDNMTLLFGAIVPKDQWEVLFEDLDVEQNNKLILNEC